MQEILLNYEYSASIERYIFISSYIKRNFIQFMLKFIPKEKSNKISVWKGFKKGVYIFWSITSLSYVSQQRLRKKMIHLERETRLFKLNRILLLAIGLWPSQQTTFSRIQFFFFSIILSTSLLFQVNFNKILLLIKNYCKRAISYILHIT